VRGARRVIDISSPPLFLGGFSIMLNLSIIEPKQKRQSRMG
jgi:hypothetical protein